MGRWSDARGGERRAAAAAEPTCLANAELSASHAPAASRTSCKGSDANTLLAHRQLSRSARSSKTSAGGFRQQCVEIHPSTACLSMRASAPSRTLAAAISTPMHARRDGRSEIGES
eukprot:6196334-Pleurochrysis_carterae.AAC.6